MVVLFGLLSIGILSYLESIGSQQWWATIIVIGLVYVLPVFFCFNKINKGHTLSNRQITGLFLVVLALPIFGYGLFGVRIPTIKSSNFYEDFITYHEASGNFTAQFWDTMEFTATGSFSAENVIHVKVTVFDSNVTDFTNHISMVAFTGSSPIISGNINIISGNNLNSVAGVGYLNLTQTSSGAYIAEGNLIWYQSIGSHSAWLAPNTTTFDQGYWQQIGQAKISISPAADTLAFESNHTILQLTYVLVGFSVVMLQPILEALFPDKLPKKEEDMTSNQGKQYYPHKK